MTIFQQYIAGDFDSLIKRKLIKSSVVEYCRIYAEFVALRSGGAKYQPALFLTAEKCSVSEKTVRRAIATVNK